MLPFNNILFPTDFSDRSMGAFHVASALARDYKAALTVLHVREVPTVAFAEFGEVPASALPSRAEVMDKLHQFDAPGESTTTEYLMADGVPADEIVRVAEDHQCDLIVMGTHGRTGISRLVMGSVAEEVVRRAACPVLTLKSPMPVAERLEAQVATV